MQRGDWLKIHWTAHTFRPFLPASGEEVTINVAWEGELLEAPASVDVILQLCVRKAGPVSFIPMEQGQMKWWAPVEHPVSNKG